MTPPLTINVLTTRRNTNVHNRKQHYAIDSQTHDTSNIVPYVEENDTPHYCASMGPQGLSLHYVIDPTGWGIQLDLGLSSAPSDCQGISSEALRFVKGGTFNPACEPGTCT